MNYNRLHEALGIIGTIVKDLEDTEKNVYSCDSSAERLRLLDHHKRMRKHLQYFVNNLQSAVEGM